LRCEGAIRSHIVQHINLPLLAPNIIAAILDEDLPDGVRLHALMINLPALWEEQRQTLG
jgi:hypothetical protein